MKRKTYFIHIGLILLYWVVTMLPGSNSIPLLDRDEPRFARATAEMMERSEWFIPYFNGDYRFDKPVMTYWLMRIPYQLLGIHEFSARLHSLLSTLAMALILYFMGRRWYSEKTGFYAGVAWLTCVQVLIHGRVAVADMPMVLAVTLSQWALYEILTGERGWKWFWMLYLSLAFGFLVKGPIALFVSLLSLTLFRLVFWRKPLCWRGLRPAIGIPLLLFLIGLWGIPALVNTGGAFWQVGMGTHVVQRGLESFNSRLFLPFYYPITSLLSLFPWVAFAGMIAYQIKHEWSSRQAFLLSWMVAPYIIFTFYKTQLPHYVMPGFPAFFLLLTALDIRRAYMPKWSLHFYWTLTFLFLLLSFIPTAVQLYFSMPAPMSPIRFVLFGLGLLLQGLCLCSIMTYYRRMSGILAAALLIGAGFFLMGYGAHRLSPVIKMQSSFSTMPEHTYYAGCRFEEPSLVFYSGQQWEMTQNLDYLSRKMQSKPAFYVVTLVEDKKLDDFLKWHFRKESTQPFDNYARELELLQPAAGTEILEIQGVNFARSSWVKLRIYKKTGDR